MLLFSCTLKDRRLENKNVLAESRGKLLTDMNLRTANRGFDQIWTVHLISLETSTMSSKIVVRLRRVTTSRDSDVLLARTVLSGHA